ncbi:Holliday junction branch migration protein RuvA [Litoribrevibacter albus]|uniref:Holliday junction branch migration complex subunit RuvA n=1 Tax=Litoribrevibacter albus TaxID=1473156 RepID=A0AA37SAM8_9GAMM|nr:Holliday junction branch migration protein RuvA [Litoribrevibacter albus]GLQ31247.1 Holliday junction ATP-dependent DNA helicase RuvA [Litoribrevibacter albus]
MIGRIKGILEEKNPPQLLVDVNGVGYEIEAPMTTIYQLGEIGTGVVLHTHLTVREDAHLLYGFISKQDRTLFKELIKVNGVGPKMALGILSTLDADQFVGCIHAEDSSALVKLPGIGKKTAERLIIEMKDRLKDWAGVTMALPLEAAAGNAPEINANADVEAESALIALGYKPTEATKMINAVKGQASSSEELIRLALKSLSKR